MAEMSIGRHRTLHSSKLRNLSLDEGSLGGANRVGGRVKGYKVDAKKEAER